MATPSTTPPSTTKTLLARDYRTGSLHRVEIKGSIYSSLEFEHSAADSKEEFFWIGPSLVDLQVNGFAGVDFNRAPASAGQLLQASNALLSQGCPDFLLTLITHPEESYQELFHSWESACQEVHSGCRGYHLEGPFLNPDPGTRGAHRCEWMKNPNQAFVARANSWAGGRIRLLTLAPEIDLAASLELIRAAVQQGIRLSAGHSLLMGRELQEAIGCGLSGWTHLGNAAPTFAHKFENVLFHALSSNLDYLSLIPDGQHLPPHVFKILAKTLGTRMLLTTDAMSGAGASEGEYTLGDQVVTVQSSGRATLSGTDKLAGSTLTPFAGVFKAAEMSGLPWSHCWEAFSTRPSQWMGWPHELAVGAPASFCLFQTVPSPRLIQVWREGEPVYCS